MLSAFSLANDSFWLALSLLNGRTPNGIVVEEEELSTSMALFGVVLEPAVVVETSGKEREGWAH